MSGDLDWMLIRELTKWGLKLVDTVSKCVDGQFHEYYLVIDPKTKPPLGIMVDSGLPPLSEERIQKVVHLVRVGLHAMKDDLKEIGWV